jgi:succinate-semialdehyde dehydrogenase/glutarate-semialdehyde dehydrogenase
MAIATVNPATGETLRNFDPLRDGEIEEKLQRSVEASRRNRARSFSDRSSRMRKTADLLDQRQKDYGRMMTTEMGKPIKAAIAEVNKCALVCRYYADRAQEFLSDESVKTEAEQSFIRYEPIGAVLAVMPWNFPFWQVFRFAAPALMAGNVGLLKHASNVPQCALAIEEVFRDAGFVDGEFQTLLITSEQVPKILEDERIKAATLTGSEPAGSSVASTAGKRIKKSVLELGGSDPFVVMPSANLDDAVNTAVKARTVNNGQSCIAAKRFIVHEKIAEEFEKRFANGMSMLKIGDPLDESTEIGPLATPQIVKDIASQVERSIAAGAKLLTGGKRIGQRGNFYAPTVLVNVPRNAAAACEETFGPVASVFRVRTAEEAIAVANDTRFGLGASVWTRDRQEAARFIDGIQSGQVFVNAMVASDPRLPFGGVKHSGFGRELGVHGIREFVNIKTVWIARMDGSGTSTHAATE